MMLCKRCSAVIRTVCTTSWNNVSHSQFSYKLLHTSKTSFSKVKQVDVFINPIDNLNEFLEAPILQSADTFRPSLEEMKSGQKFFYPEKGKEIEFLKSVIEMDALPSYNLPEVAVIGRSNVGKSSLLQAMFSKSHEHFVRVSKTPGHTKMMNFFKIGKLLTVIDMPGYGYRMPGHFEKSVEQYLRIRRNLQMTFQLIDGEVGLTVKDKEYLEKLISFAIPHCLVLTKIDKATPHKLLRTVLTAMKYIKENTYCCHSQPFLTSAETGEGIPLLQTFIAYLSGNLHIEGM